MVEPFRFTPAKPHPIVKGLAITVVAVVVVPVLVVGIAFAVSGITNWYHTQQRGSANPGAHRGSVGAAVTLTLDPTRPASWAAPPLASGVTGAAARAGDLAIAATGRAEQSDETGQLVATDAAGKVVWRSARHRSAVIGVWAVGDRVYSFWRRTNDRNVLLDEARITTTDMFVALDARTGRELWWVLTYDNSDADMFSLSYDADETPDAALASVPGSVALSVRGEVGPSYVIVFDPEARTARWHAVAACGVDADAATLRLSCGAGFAAVALVSGQASA